MNTQTQNKNSKNDENIFDFSNPTSQDMMKFLLNPAGMTVGLLKAAGQFLYGLLRMACVPAELIFRRKFGERHFSLLHYFGGLLWFWAFASGYVNVTKMLGIGHADPVSNGAVFTAVGAIFFGAMFWHLVIRKFLPINMRVYSYYDGDILPFFYRLPHAIDAKGVPREYLIRQVFEPLFLFLLGIVLTAFLNQQTGSWIVLTAIGMALKEYVQGQKFRNMILDQIDADIIARNLGAVIKGDSPKNTQGIYLAGVPNDGNLRKELIRTAKTKRQVTS